MPLACKVAPTEKKKYTTKFENSPTLRDCADRQLSEDMLLRFWDSATTPQQQKKTLVSIHNLFNLLRFLEKTASISNEQTLVLTTAAAVRFFLLDGLPCGERTSNASIVLKEVFADDEKRHEAALQLFEDPVPPSDASDFFIITEDTDGTLIHLAFGGVFARSRTDMTIQDISQAILKRRLHLSKTLAANIARIFAANAAGSALLLEGPPGVGKTLVCKLVCECLGVPLERINMSSSTTVAQLIGAVVPTIVDDKRVFQFRPGKLLVAMRNAQYILLDEINLAPPEVLERIASLWKVSIASRSSGKRAIRSAFQQLGRQRK